MRDGRSAGGDNGCVTAYRTAGLVCAAVGWVLFVMVQVVAADPFPPEISLSQYGVGPDGWLFSLWVVVIAAVPVLCYLYRPVPGPARWFLAVGVVGNLVMAIVRTDEGGLQLSTQSKIHTGGAVLAMVGLPLGMVLALWYAKRWARRAALLLCVCTTVTGILILVSATGVDTAGIGQARSWALWQGISIVLDLLLVSLYALAVESIPAGLRRGTAMPRSGASTLESPPR